MHVFISLARLLFSIARWCACTHAVYLDAIAAKFLSSELFAVPCGIRWPTNYLFELDRVVLAYSHFQFHNDRWTQASYDTLLQRCNEITNLCVE
jgi:hypothetical protein